MLRYARLVADGRNARQVAEFDVFEQRAAAREELENAKQQLATAREQVNRPFPQEDELKAKSARLDELNIALNLDKRDNEDLDDGEELPKAG